MLVTGNNRNNKGSWPSSWEFIVGYPLGKLRHIWCRTLVRPAPRRPEFRQEERRKKNLSCVLLQTLSNLERFVRDDVRTSTRVAVP